MLEDAVHRCRVEAAAEVAAATQQQAAAQSAGNAAEAAAQTLIREFIAVASTLREPLPVGVWIQRGPGSPHHWKGLGPKGWCLGDIAVLEDGRCIRYPQVVTGTGLWGKWRGLRGQGLQAADPYARLPQDRTRLKFIDFRRCPRDSRGAPILTLPLKRQRSLADILAEWVVVSGR